MVNYDKFKMTKEDVDMAIEDFFTQLLIEARRQKSEARTLSDLSSECPKVCFVTGQPGSGKTTLGRLIKNQFRDNGECVVELGSDKIATYHKDYNEIVKVLLPEEGYNITRQFVRVAEGVISEKIMDSKINIIQEISLSKGEKDYKKMQDFRDMGYEVELNVIAVDKYESFLSCIERSIKLLELGYDARQVSRMNHDRMYESFLQETLEIDRNGIANKTNVYVRGDVLNQVKLVYTTGDNSYSSAQEAIISERTKNRRQILREPQKYLERIAIAKEKIKLMIQDERLKKNYLEKLNQLEVEFLNELAFERSYND